MRPLTLGPLLLLPLVAACTGAPVPVPSDAAPARSGYVSPYAIASAAMPRTEAARARAYRAPVSEAEKQAALARAFAANEPAASVRNRLKDKPLLDWSPDDIAAFSVMMARSACGIPDGQRITPDMPCRAP